MLLIILDQNFVLPSLCLGTKYCEKRDVVGPFSKFNPIKRVDSQNLLKDTLYSKRSLKNNYTYEKTRIEYGRKYQPVKHYSIDLATLSNANRDHRQVSHQLYRNNVHSHLSMNLDMENP